MFAVYVKIYNIKFSDAFYKQCYHNLNEIGYNKNIKQYYFVIVTYLRKKSQHQKV